MTPASSGSATPCGKELRIALAMRGGVSLAAWIGGAVAELDLVRRAMLDEPVFTPGEKQDGGSEARGVAIRNLLRGLGYTRVTIDVLAGASAGGLNAIIYGWAQAVGTDIEWVRGVWREQGDLWRLFHPQWQAGKPFRTEGLLAGDAFFYETVLGELETRSKAPRHQALCVDYVTIDLAATLQTGPPLRSRRGEDDLRPRTAHFRFRKTGGRVGLLNDLPGATDEEEASREALRSLAYAARATSSFPGAFEPAEVFSRPSARGDLRTRLPGDDRPQNMAEVFSEIYHERDVPFDVMDGGVFDNIPISRAVSAIADTPAAGRTKRILVYLDPDPPRTAATPVVRESLRDGVRLSRAKFLRSILTALRYKQAVESSSDDLRDIRRLQAVGEDTRRRRSVFIRRLPSALPADEGELATLRTAYQRYRATTDTARLIGLMMAPGVGFLRALVRNPPVATAMSAELATQTMAPLAFWVKKASGSPELDATALVAANDLLISWVRILLDTKGSTLDASRLAASKQLLYVARTAGLYVQQQHDAEAALAALGQGSPPPPADELIDLEVVAAALRQPPADTIDAPPLASDAQLWSLLDEVASEPGRDLNLVVARGWHTTCLAVNELTADRTTNPVLAQTLLLGEPRELTPATAQRLAMAASLTIGSLTNTAVPEFFSFTGDEEPLASPPLSRVVEEERAIALDEAFRTNPRESLGVPDRPVSAASKLAGNQLANFAGFLDAEWRLHDWHWGRADAAAGLVRAMRKLHPEEAEASWTQVEASLSGLSGAQPGVPTLDRHKYRLVDLSPARRFALVSRMLLALQRALWPITERSRSATGAWPGTPAYLSALALVAFRPILVLLPLLVRPMALVGVVVMLSLDDHVARDRSLAPAVLAWLVGGVAVILLIDSLRLWQRRRKWALLVHEADPSIVERVRQVVGRAAARNLVLMGLAVVILLVVLGWLPSPSKVRSTLLSASGFDVAVSVALVLWLTLGSRTTAVSAIRSRANPVSADPAGVVGSVGVLLLAAVGLVVADLSGTVDLVALAGALAVAAVLLAVHFGLAETVWCAVLPALGAVMTYGLLCADTPQTGWQVDPASVQPLVDVGLVLAVAVGVFGLALTARALGRLGTLGVVVGLSMLMAGALVGAWLVLLHWGWLGGVPRGLVFGGVIAAATTLVVPFKAASPAAET